MKPMILDNWCLLPTPLGDFRMYDTGDEGVRLVCLGDVRAQGKRPLIRIHSSCMASEVFGARDCDCADQLNQAMKMIANDGRGLIVHLHQEGRGQGLSNKIRSIGAMQRDGLDTVEAFDALGLEQDTRSYEQAVEILRTLGHDEVRLITNNPAKADYLRQHGIRVEVVTRPSAVREENIGYLRTKRDKLGHTLAIDGEIPSNGVIRFYHSDGPFGDLSNFSAHAVFLGGMIWPTTEHYYQAQKFSGTVKAEGIRRCPSPTKAKLLARSWNGSQRADWARVKEDVMLEALRAKFTQHPNLRELLVATADATLVEHCADDEYWGDAGDGSGQNRLGQLLMQLRRELSSSGSDTRRNA